MSTKIIAAVAVLLVAAAAAAEERIGAITAIRGTVSITRADGTVVESAKLTDEVRGGDRVKTGPGATVKILFDDDILVIIGPESSAVMKEHVGRRHTGFGRFIIILERGAIRSMLERLSSGGSVFGIETNNAVAGVVGTDFMVEYREAGLLTSVLVREGRVRLRGLRTAGQVIVPAGDYSEVVGAEGTPSEPRPMSPEMKKRLTSLDVEEKTVSRQKSPPAAGAAVRPPVRSGMAANPQVDAVGGEPIFVGGPFGSPAGPAAGPKPSGGGGGGGRSGRFSDLGEFLGK